MKRLRAGKGIASPRPAPPRPAPPRPASSAAAVGMETSTPRAGSQLAPTAARHSASYRAEPLRVSSREELAEMAAASQGKDERARRWRREEPTSRAPEGDGLRASQAQQRPWGGLSAAGAGRAPGARPWPGRSRGPAKVSGLAGTELALSVVSGRAPPPSGPAPDSLGLETFCPCSRKHSGTLRLTQVLCPFGLSFQTPGRHLSACRPPLLALLMVLKEYTWYGSWKSPI